MAFHDVQFPASLSFGSVGGPERRTEIVSLANGFEERNTPWSASRRRYDAGLGMRSLDDIEAVIAFFEARSGQLHGFRWKDWSDHKSCAPSGTIAATDQQIGTGDGSTVSFQLTKTYASGPATYVREITKPVAGSVRIAAGAELAAEAFAVDTATGIVTLDSAPGVGVPVTAGFAFDVPVRFDTDSIQISLAGFEAGDVPSIPVVELRV